MFATFLKLADEHPSMRERTFVLTEIFPEPRRGPSRWMERKRWVNNKQGLRLTLAYLEELSYVRVKRANGLNIYRILPECWTFLEERLALQKERPL